MRFYFFAMRHIHWDWTANWNLRDGWFAGNIDLVHRETDPAGCWRIIQVLLCDIGMEPYSRRILPISRFNAFWSPDWISGINCCFSVAAWCQTMFGGPNQESRIRRSICLSVRLAVSIICMSQKTSQYLVELLFYILHTPSNNCQEKKQLATHI